MYIRVWDQLSAVQRERAASCGRQRFARRPCGHGRRPPSLAPLVLPLDTLQSARHQLACNQDSLKRPPRPDSCAPRPSRRATAAHRLLASSASRSRSPLARWRARGTPSDRSMACATAWRSRSSGPRVFELLLLVVSPCSSPGGGSNRAICAVAREPRGRATASLCLLLLTRLLDLPSSFDLPPSTLHLRQLTTSTMLASTLLALAGAALAIAAPDGGTSFSLPLSTLRPRRRTRRKRGKGLR